MYLPAKGSARNLGQLSDENTTADIHANDQLLKAADYRPLVVAYRNGAAIKLSDVADVEDSVENVRAGFAKWELYSDHNGEFAQRVPAGRADYLVTADLKDYKLNSAKKLQAGSEVTVHIDNDERADIGLHLKYQEL